MGAFNSLPPESVNFYGFWAPMDDELPPPVERKKSNPLTAPSWYMYYIYMYV